MRSTRTQPFCWQEKKILRLFKERYTGNKLSKFRNLYLTITQIDSDFNNQDIDYYTKTISTYSGLSTDWIPSGLKELEKLKIIKIVQIRSGGKFQGTRLVFTPENIEELPLEKPLKPTVKVKPGNGESVTGESAPLEDSTILENLIVTEAEKSPRFTEVFSCFLTSDDNNHRKEALYWIMHNAKKHNNTLNDIIEALQTCYDKEKVGDMSYLTGILRNKNKNRQEGIKPIGKPPFFIVEEFLRERLEMHSQYVKHFEIDLAKSKLYYKVYDAEDKKPVSECMNLVVLDLEKETGVVLKPQLRIK